MKLTNLTLKDLLTDDAKLVFLVGAGCSVDPPSCLPAGRKMMEAIINYTCAKSEIENIKKLEELRFEQLVEIIRDNLDPELKIIDYYGQCDKPNLQHFFLADMIKKGHFVMTTNFDFLIEYALQELGVTNNEIKVIITKEDFVEYDNPQDLYLDGFKTLYKIHGSTKNIITGESTRDSLIATIRAFGANKEGRNIFQLEPFKQSAFINLTKDCSLLVLGYSGSDDFDIIPTLKVLKDLKNLIWINHIIDDNEQEIIYEIIADSDGNSVKLDKINQILLDIKRSNEETLVYRIDINTTRMLKKLHDFKPSLSQENFAFKVKDWLEKSLRIRKEIEKLCIPSRIYMKSSQFENAMSCSEKILSITGGSENLTYRSMALNDIGEIYLNQGRYNEALKTFEEALEIDNRLGNVLGKVNTLHNIAGVYQELGNYPEALIRYEKVLQFYGGLDKEVEAIWIEQENPSGLIKRYREIAKARESITLNNIGEIYHMQGKYPDALRKYEEALWIDEQTGNLSGKATRLNNIAGIYQEQGNNSEALKRYEVALQIDEQLGNLLGKAIILSNIGQIYSDQKNYSKALKKFKEAIQIDGMFGNLSGKAGSLNNIAGVYRDLGNYPKALKYSKKAIEIEEKLGHPSGIHLRNIAEIYRSLRDYAKALKQCEKAIQIDNQLGNHLGKALDLRFMARIYLDLGNYPKVIKLLEESIEIINEHGLSQNLVALGIKEDFESARKIIKYEIAEKKGKLGRNDPCYCGSGKKYKNCHWRQDNKSPY